MEGVKAFPDRVYAILCCCLQCAFPGGGRQSFVTGWLVDARVFGSSAGAQQSACGQAGS